jgi:hypothetical protein
VGFRKWLLYLSVCIAVSVPGRAVAQDAKVWVNTKSGVYHCPGTRYYGATKSGNLMAESAARRAGNRPAYGQACSAGTDGATLAPNTPPALASASQLAPAAASRSKVWVNTKSGVYHCPGSRYYGTTRSGTYMSQSEARDAGNRPAYGAACP